MRLSDEARKIRNEYARAWREKNQPKVNKYQREWKAQNKDKVKQYNLDYWEKRADKQKTDQNNNLLGGN